MFVKDRQHRWVLLNDTYCYFVSHSREKLIGKSDYDFFPQAEADVFRQQDELVFTTNITNENQDFFTDAQGITISSLQKSLALKMRLVINFWWVVFETSFYRMKPEKFWV
ncbi:PAS domain-containing protein [Nostoc sp.]|uniref:PAS domain-containing protein n=1 Tax=Nostoc sp. TaxID=1180 RepID=UPI003FA57B0B